jgi:hypothetical protein
VPSGEVAPMPGDGFVWPQAAAMPLNHIIAAKAVACRINVSHAGGPAAVTLVRAISFGAHRAQRYRCSKKPCSVGRVPLSSGNVRTGVHWSSTTMSAISPFLRLLAGLAFAGRFETIERPQHLTKIS